MYHVVSDKKLPHIDPLYKVFDKTEFESQLDQLLSAYHFVTPEDLTDGSSDNKIHLSFDDGLIECHSVIRPMLKKKGIKATFFVNPDFVEGQNIFYRYKAARLISCLRDENLRIKLCDLMNMNRHDESLIQDKLLSFRYDDDEILDGLLEKLGVTMKNDEIYMSKDMIKDLVEDGHSIGGHGLRHKAYHEMKLEEMISDAKQSVDYCQKHFDSKLRLFAFPFYDFSLSKLEIESVIEKAELDYSFGTSGLKDDVTIRSIQRLPAEHAEGSLTQYIRRSLVKSQIRLTFGFNTLKRRS